MSKRREQIGECPCIAKGCDLVAAVFKFEQRAGDDAARRFGGKLYAHCPGGHVFGTRGDSQEWIMEKGTIWGDRKHGTAPGKAASAPVAAPVEKPEKPGSAPVTPPAQPAAQPAAKPAPKPAPKGTGFGFFK